MIAFAVGLLAVIIGLSFCISAIAGIFILLDKIPEVVSKRIQIGFFLLVFLFIFHPFLMQVGHYIINLF